MAQTGQTYLKNRHEAGEASVKVKVKEEAYNSLRKSHTGTNEDELTVEALDPGGKIRGEANATEPEEKPETEKKH
jgi:hypothetical protein